MNEYSIERIKLPMQELVGPIRHLLGQLTTKEMEFDLEALERIVQSPSSELFILRGEEVVGMLTIGIYSSPTGRKVWVEDVVVDSRWRGQGLGRELINEAIKYCQRELAPCTLMLTSNPARIEANELYRTSGFEPKHTNVYKYDCL